MTDHVEVVVLGELCADIVVDVDTEIGFGQAETIVPSTRLTMGSSSAITACGLARLGQSTALVSSVGDDVLGRFLLDELEARHVSTAAVRVDPSRATGTSTILNKPDGDRAILTALGSIGTVTTVDVPPTLVRNARHAHVGSYFLQYALHGELANWYAARRAAGTTTSLDPNFDPSGVWDSAILDVVAHTDTLFANEEEACGIAQVSRVDDAIALLVGALPREGILVLKRGAQGAEAHGRAGLLARCAPPDDPRRFVDAVGAGDSLGAGFLAARLRGRSIEDALRIGVANGTASTRAGGGVGGQLTWDEVRRA